MRFIGLVSTVVLLGALLYYYDSPQIATLVDRLDWHAVAAFSLLLIGNFLFACLRFHVLLGRFQVRVPLSVSFRANALSQLTGILLLPIFGHIVGRAGWLRGHDVPVSVLASVTMYEKLITLFCSGLLCVAGFVYIFGDVAVTQISHAVGKIHLVHIAAIAGMGLLLSHRLGALRLERRLWRRMASRRSSLIAIEAGFITLAAQACMVGAYSIAIGGLEHPISPVTSLAASSIIMFAAGLPVSINGWGVREAASVFVLGQLGVPGEEALGVSIAVGLAGLLCILAAAGLAVGLPGGKISRRPVAPSGGPVADLQSDKTIGLLLSILAAIAIYFQLHIPFRDTLIAVNAADPLALTGGAFFLVYWFHRGRSPQWRIPKTSIALAVLTAAVVVAFLIGYARFGSTTWALNNRLVGWFILLAYLFTGALAAALWGNNGLRRILESFVAIGSVIALYLALWAHLAYFKLARSLHEYIPSFETMSPNRNALALQLIVALIAALVLSAHANGRRLALLTGGIGVLFAGIVLTGSRAGMGTAAIVCLIALGLRFVRRRQAWQAGIVALCLLFAAPAITTGLNAAFDLNLKTKRNAGWSMAKRADKNIEVSNQERIDSIVGGLRMWLDHPVEGAGLGAYLHSVSADPNPVLIHSTPIWLMAEFGLVGFALFAFPFAVLLRRAWRTRNAGPESLASRILLLSLIAAAVFCTVHEILYQRILWLLLGSCLALRLAAGPAVPPAEAVAAKTSPA